MAEMFIQLRLFSAEPQMTLECPCGNTFAGSGNEAVWRGWHLPANWKKLKRDGFHMLATCRECNCGRGWKERRLLWRFGPPDSMTEHEWFQKQQWPEGHHADG